MASSLPAPPADASLRLTRFDRRLILLAIVVTLASLWVATHYFYRAFPEASIDFRVSSSASAGIAQDFLRQRGLMPAGDMHAVQFDYDDDAKTFLERELGLDRAQALLSGPIRLWRWENRWFRPLTAEEFAVGVTPGGAVVSFDHTIADEAPGASLDATQARALAERFLTGVMRFDLARLSFVGQAQQVRAHRTDYLFTWKDAAPLVPGATGVLAQAEYRHAVRVQGDQIGAYDEYLQIPDQWQRDYASLRSKNDTAGGIDTALMIALLLVGMLIVLARRIARGDIKWRPALWIGGVGAVLSFLNALNELPGQRFDYQTTSSYGAFLSSTVFEALLSAIGVGVLLALLTAAGEALYRERFGGQVALNNWLSWRGVRSKSFLISVVLGLTLAAFFFAYQTVFYLIANHFGAWAPADTPYDAILNTRFPWIAVLLGGFFPAISEEFGFRMLAIPLFEKWFRNLWIAVLVASFLWGFGHALYPNQPFYIRGVEVGLGGILLSWMMIRFGILTTVVWHYTVDAIYTAMLLLRAHSAYFRFTGGLTAFFAVVPLLFAAIAYLRTGHFAAARDLTNAAAGTAPPPPAEPAAPVEAAARPAYQPVSYHAWIFGGIVAIAMLSAFAIRLPRWDAALPFTTSRDQAVAAARDFLRSEGYNASGDRVAAEAATPDSLSGELGEDNQIAANDLFALRGRAALIHAFSGPPPTVVARYWRVRFFQPLREEGFSVGVRTDGNGPAITGFAQTLPESAPGASPNLDAARALAAEFLARRGIEVGGFVARAAQQEHRTARVDSDFVWESPNPLLPSGTAYRVEAELAGDRVSLFHAWYYVPESRVRAYERTGLGATLLGIAPWLLAALVVVMIVREGYRFSHAAAVAWRPLLKIAAVATALGLWLLVNNIPQSLNNYDTTLPWSAFLVTIAVQAVVACVGAFLITLILLAPLGATAPTATRLFHARGWRDAAPWWAADAAGAGLLGIAWMAGWQRAATGLSSAWHRGGQAPMPDAPAIASYLPPLGDFARALLTALWVAALLGILLPLLSAGWRKRGWGRGLAVLALVLAWASALPSVHSGAQFALGAIVAAVELILLLLFARFFLRNNPLAYLSAVLVAALAGAGLNWFALGDALGPHYAAIAGSLLLAAAIVWLLWLWHLSRRATGAPGVTA